MPGDPPGHEYDGCQHETQAHAGEEKWDRRRIIGVRVREPEREQRPDQHRRGAEYQPFAHYDRMLAEYVQNFFVVELVRKIPVRLALTVIFVFVSHKLYCIRI